MKRKGKVYIIISLILTVGLMIIGYAAYNQKLNISETSKIDSNFNILITNIEIKEVGGQAVNNGTPEYKGLEAKFDITFNKKNDYIEYNVEVSNKGNIEAYLNQIKINNEKSKEVSMSYRDINVGDKLGIGESKTFVVRVEYQEGSGSGEANILLDYGQENKPGEIILPENYERNKVIYNTEENGGEKGLIEEKRYSKGEGIDLGNVGKKEGYRFVGWNTNKEAKEAIKELIMGEEEITLYAIYKKEIKVRYKIGDGIKEIPKEEDTCEIYNKEETCNIELPSRESIKVEDGRIIDGWYKGEEKIENNIQKVREESIYEIKAYTDTPAEIEINTSPLSNSIRVVTNVINNIEIERYEYSIDNSEYIESNNTYSFNELEHNREYNIKVRVTTKGGKVTEKEITVRTLEIEPPTFTEEIDGIVKITYPEECNERYTCTYIKDNEEEVTITKNPEEVIFGSSGTVIAKVTDGTNYITSSTYTVERTNLYVSSSGNDEEGYGTKELPYKTLNKAYDCASLIQEATIYVMDDITVNETTTLDEDKTVTITSYSEDGSVNSLIRGNSLTTYLLDQNSGILKFSNIKINGNNVPSIKPMIKFSSQGFIESGTIITNAKNTNEEECIDEICGYSAGAIVNFGNLTLNDGEISHNVSVKSGAGISTTGTFVMNNGSIFNNFTAQNYAADSGGGICNYKGIVYIKNGNIFNNKADMGGGIKNTGGGTLNIQGGNIYSNEARSGGGIQNHGTINMSGGNIYSNAANNPSSGSGGGIDSGTGGYINITGGAVRNNIAKGNGGGIAVAANTSNGAKSTLVLDGGVVKNNTATTNGGLGIYNSGVWVGTYIYKSGTVCGNTPTNSYETSASCP